MLAVGGLYAALPDALSVGPKWLVPLLVGLLSAHIVISHRVGHHAAHVVQGHLLAGILTAFMLWSLVLLVRALPAHKQPPVELLRSAAGLWITNVLIFALWYWRLDAGGPHQRFLRKEHTSGAFLFPQMTHDGRPKDKGGVVTEVHRLFVPCLQHQHGSVADRHAGAVEVG